MSSSKYLILVLLLMLLLLLLLLDDADGQSEICPSMRIVNEVSNLNHLRNCRIVMGNLQIVLMDRHANQTFDNYEFPKLEEVWDFVIVMRVFNLRSIGKLFPNLKVIRGRKLFLNYALIFFGNKDLEEIGLTSLQRIERGNVRIQRCTKLCYYDTVNWKDMGTNMEYVYENNSEAYENNSENICLPCPKHCKVGCWSQDQCQQEATDHMCKKFLDDGKCVDKCPQSKILLHSSNICVTREECKAIPKMQSKTWFEYDGTCTNRCPPKHQLQGTNKCVFCGNDCKKVCPGDEDDVARSVVVNSMSTAEDLSECDYINGSLRISVNENSVADELPKHLGQIKEIWGHLKIHRSDALKSLEFLKNLQLIRGDYLESNNSLIVLDNQNLDKLWDWNEFKLKIAKGTLQFHFNPKLCLSEIEVLNNRTLRTELSPLLVSRDSNGDQTMCKELQINLEKSIINPTNVTLNWEESGLAVDVTYFIYYMEKDLLSKESMCKSGWSVVYTTEDSVTIDKLEPYTNYSFYITKSVSNRKNQYRTQIHNFTTLSDDPSEPMNVRAIPHNSSALNFTWEPPTDPKGKLQKYVFSYYKLPDDEELLRRRNYCRHPVSPFDDDDENDIASKLISKTASSNNTCPCPNAKREAIEEMHLNLLDRQFGNMIIDVSKTYYYSESASLWNYSDIITNEDINFNSTIDSGNANENPETNTETIVYKEHIVPPNETSTTISNLDHFSTYVFYVSVCNENRTTRQQCSAVVMVYNRTLKSVDADNLSNFRLIDKKNGAILNWTNPTFPNSPVLSYTIEWKSVGVIHSATQRCITTDSLSPNGYMLVLAPGIYNVRLRANTLAGPGKFTTFLKLRVTAPYSSSDKSLLIGTLCGSFVVICFVVGGCYYVRWKRRRFFDEIHLIRRINPEYMGTTYVVDDWEIERSNLELGNTELGKGTFGVVYSGVIKDKQLSCAIKTVNVNATYEEKIDFLNEASVMKSFSSAHHVIKLLGVVSQGPSPLVVMELMACGDLKTFLRRSRDSSKSIRCNEMFRMAAEIADGMAYLTAKKFVHRDLAARNCMVSCDMTVKIGDFGMARDIYETDYYRKETKGLLPVRWMAPESLADGVFSSDSDVWSYGVVLWEMATLAEQPYQGLANEQVFQFVTSRGCLSRPPECPDLLFEIMDVCWKWRPNSRPLFIDIVQKLENHVGQDFRLVSFYHSREGEEYRLNMHERPFNPPAMNLHEANPPFVHFNKSDENVDLFPGGGGEPNRPNHHLSSFPDQRQTLLSDLLNDNASDTNGYSSYTHMTP